jgi:hypothetical protein
MNWWSRNKQALPIYLLLISVAALALRQLTQCDFIIYDDPTYVTENIHVSRGISFDAIRWAFTSFYASNWHPLTWMSHMADVQFFGLNPHLHHMTNLLFHIANTLLLFFVFNRMTKAPWKSAFVAALFAIHPLHVESVAWVAERKDVLSTFFWMLAMAAYVYYVERPSFFRYSNIILLFALGLMAKPMLVTFPFVLLLLDYWPLKRMSGIGCQTPLHSSDVGHRVSEVGSGEPVFPSRKKRKSAKKLAIQRPPQSSVLSGTLRRPSAERRTQFSTFYSLVLEKIPLFALSAISCVVTCIAQQKGGALAPIEALPLGARIANALVSYVVYIGKTLWPNDLSIFYPHPGLPPYWRVLGATLLLFALTFAAVWKAKRLPYLAVGWLWFAGTLVPVIGIVQVGAQAMADRYTYIPLTGLFIVAAWGCPELLQKCLPTRFPKLRRAALMVAPALILTCLFLVADRQAGYWRDSVSISDHSLEATGPNAAILVMRGAAYGHQGDLLRAIHDYDEALKLRPQNAEAFYNRAVAYGKLGNSQGAIEDYTRVVGLNPRHMRAYFNRGAAYARLGLEVQAFEDMKTAARLNCEEAKNILKSRGMSW